MNVTTDPNASADAELPQNALAVYAQGDGVEDFPVLKAFQQYIDAEQLKSRKRMVLLSMFFGFLMTVMIAIFVFLLYVFNQRNQALNDRLIDFAMKDRDRAPAAVQPAPAAPSGSDEAMKAVTATLVALQKKMSEAQKKSEPAAAPEPYRPTPAELERTRRAEAELKMVNEARAKLEAERKAIAEERERRRQDEIERYRRRNYPELYAQPAPQRPAAAPAATQVAAPEAASAATTARAPARRELTDRDIEDILREVDQLPSAPNKAADKKASGGKDDDGKKDDGKKDDGKKDDGKKDDEDLKPKRYFDDEATQYDLPVKVNGKSAGWRLPLK